MGAGTVAARLLHALPPLAARGFTCRKKFQTTGGSGAASSPLPFLTGGDLQNNPKTQQAIDFILFYFGFTDLFVSILDLLCSWFLMLLCFVVLCWWPVQPLILGWKWGRFYGRRWRKKDWCWPVFTVAKERKICWGKASVWVVLGFAGKMVMGVVVGSVLAERESNGQRRGATNRGMRDIKSGCLDLGELGLLKLRWRRSWVWPGLCLAEGKGGGKSSCQWGLVRLICESGEDRLSGKKRIRGNGLVVSGWWRWVKERKPTGPSWGGGRLPFSTGKWRLWLVEGEEKKNLEALAAAAALGEGDES